MHATRSELPFFHLPNRVMRAHPLLPLLVLIAPVAPLPADGPPPQRAAWTDAQGNSLKRATTGHVTNYDEARVGSYTLPDPLVLSDGRHVRDAETWEGLRRPEILELYRADIYGRVPSTAPQVRFEVVDRGAPALGGRALRRIVAARFGRAPDSRRVFLVMYLPARAARPVPMLLHLTFTGDPSVPASYRPIRPPPTGAGPASGAFTELAPIDEVLARGYGYAIVRYTQIEPDGKPDPTSANVRGLALQPGATPPPDAWGSLSAWAWGASRIVDYFETDPSVDSKRIALIGHSRLGKTAIWAGAQDARFAVVFSSCAGEMGTSLARRDYGETVDDMASGFPWQFAGRFQRYVGHWNELPVDTHFAIALNAPHPVLITAGTQDQWADPRGEFLAEVAAGPVYRLLGRRDLGTSAFPPPDRPVVSGDLAFNYHTGPHRITAGEWRLFLDFAGRYFDPGRPSGPMAGN